MPKKYDVVAVTGSYQKDGQEKARFKNMGAVIEKNGKFYLHLDTMVTLHDDGHVISWFQLYAPKDEQKQDAPVNNVTVYDDDIPF